MKSILLSFAAIFLMASCSNKLSIQKRKYNKGFYIAKSRGNNTIPNKRSDELSKRIINEEVNSELALAISEKHNEQAVPSINHSIAKFSKTSENIPSEQGHNQQRIFADAGNSSVSIPKQQIKAYPLSNHAEGSNLKGGSGVNEAVLIILSIFLPPLAVFLFDDGITTNFWIDLILTILGWLPGIIFALLVCFAGVSVN